MSRKRWGGGKGERNKETYSRRAGAVRREDKSNCSCTFSAKKQGAKKAAAAASENKARGKVSNLGSWALNQVVLAGVGGWGGTAGGELGSAVLDHSPVCFVSRKSSWRKSADDQEITARGLAGYHEAGRGPSQLHRSSQSGSTALTDPLRVAIGRTGLSWLPRGTTRWHA